MRGILRSSLRGKRRTHGKEAGIPDRLWSDDDEINRYDRAYHEREQEQWGGGREETLDTIDLQ